MVKRCADWSDRLYFFAALSTASTTISVGRFVYTVIGMHKELSVGSDYPAKVDKRALLMLVDGKGRKYHITGVQEQ
jgi:hypothetical protein